MSRFDYIDFDSESKVMQRTFQGMFEDIERYAVNVLQDSRARSLLMTALEEAYMWTGKAIRDDQILRRRLTASILGDGPKEKDNERT